MKKIFIVEDDEIIREELTQFLENADYQIVALSSGDHALQALKDAPADLLLLDVNMPGQDGFTLCRKIRSFSQIPIIFITARDAAMDELKELMLGADDYITKPYNLPVLLARISVLLKRISADDADSLIYHEVILNPFLANLQFKDKTVELSKTELKIIYYLFQNRDKIVPRLDLIEFLWDNQIHIDDNTLSVHMTRLREKLRQIGVNDFIQTKRGLGYRL